MLYYRITGKDGRGEEQIATLKAKSKRRSVRHFRGVDVKHRVVKKDTTSIEFAWFRRNKGTPVHIRWRKADAPPPPPEQAKASVKVTVSKGNVRKSSKPKG